MNDFTAEDYALDEAPGCHVLLPAAALAVAIYWRGE